MVFQVCHLDFVIKMADIAHDGHVFHFAHMLDADHVLIARGGDKHISAVHNIFQNNHFEPIHRGLQGADRINLCYFDARASPGQ